MPDSVTIEPTLLVAQPRENGFTWTLPSRLGDMLFRATEMFGPRDQSYTILGIEFVADNPRLWLPGNRRNIVIQLSFLAARDMFQACYQLAHETIHLLSPSGGEHANNLEEGLATYFARYYMRTQFDQSDWRPTVRSYERVLNLIGPHLVDVPDAICRLRVSQPMISAITAAQLRDEFRELSAREAEFLIQPFERENE